MGAAWDEAWSIDRPDGELAMSAYLGMPEPVPTGVPKLDQLLGGGMTLLIGNVVEMSFTKGLYHSGSGLALILMAFVMLSSLLTEGKGEEGGALLP